MNSARQKSEKSAGKVKFNEKKGFEEKLKIKGPTKVLTTRPMSSKINQNVELS
jgi:hypothetical protein